MTQTAPPHTDENPAVRWVVTRLGDGWPVVAGLALVYLLSARLSLAAMDPAQGIVVLWPISGLGVVSVALIARRRRAALLGALIAAGLVANLWAGMAWWPSTAVAVANGAESWLGALVLTTAAGRSGHAVLHGERAALALVGTAILAPAIAGLGAAVAVTSSVDVVFLDVWRSWWIADGLGILLVGILALAIRSRSGGPTETPPMLQWAMVGVVTGVAVAVFGAPAADPPTVVAYAYPVALLTALLPFICGWLPTAAGLIAVGAAAVIGTTGGRGPFVARFGETHNQILQLQGFLVLSSFVVLLVATALDLRRAQHAALEEARASLHNLVENSPDMILRYDRDRRVVFANRALSQAVDRSLSEIIGRPLLPREARAEALAGWERALDETFRTGMPGQTEFRRTTDDREVVYQSWLIPERDASGAIDTILVISRNVTAERTATARLQATLAAREASERRYRSVVGLMNGGLVLQARDGRIVECNPAAERILGLSRDQMLGRTSIDPRWRAVRTDGSPLPGEEHAAMRTLATGEPITGEVMGVHTPDGRLTWISVSTQTLPASDADDPAVIASFTDITERLRAENDQVALRRVAVLVASGADPRTTHDAIAHEAATMLDADRAVVARIGLGSAIAEPLGWWSITPRSGPIHGVPHPFDRDSLICRLVADPTTLRVDRRRDPSAHTALLGDADNVAAVVAAPVRVEGELWGALIVGRGGGADFAPGDETRLESLAQLAALAVVSTQARERLTTLAGTDPLTGLANRRAFDECLQEEIARSARSGEPLALVSFDIDHFKRINDRHGHPEGDRVLRRLAMEAGGLTRQGELLARVGGEEFAWLLPRCDLPRALAAAERLRRAVEDTPFARVGPVTISLGVAVRHANDPAPFTDLVARADRALYRAKEAGRNRVEADADPAPVGG